MKKFQFRLQRLLDIREAKKKEVQNELAKVLSIQNREKQRQEEYRKSIIEQHEKFNNRMKGGRFSYSDALMFERYIDFAHRVIISQQEKIDSMEPEIQKVRERLVEASKHLKVVEKLKERQWNEYQYELNREIFKENDDTNQKIFLKRRMEEAHSS